VRGDLRLMLVIPRNGEWVLSQQGAVEAGQRPTRNPNYFCEEKYDVVASRTTNWMGDQKEGFVCQTPRELITNNDGLNLLYFKHVCLHGFFVLP